MRCAAAELVVINAIVNHIFTDVYIPGAVQVQKAVSTTLKLLEKDPRRESLVRCQLLAEFEIQAETSRSVAQAALNEVCAALDSLLPAGEPRQRFHTKLAELLNDAFELWQPLQISKERVYADLSVDAQMLDRTEDSYSDYDYCGARESARPRSPTSTSTQAVHLLFPMICMGEHPIFDPKALWSDQAAFVEARSELVGDRTSVHGSMGGAVDATRPQMARRRNSASIRMPQSPIASALPSSSLINGSSGVSGSHLVPGRRSENGIKLTGRSNQVT